MPIDMDENKILSQSHRNEITSKERKIAGNFRLETKWLCCEALSYFISISISCSRNYHQ